MITFRINNNSASVDPCQQSEEGWDQACLLHLLVASVVSHVLSTSGSASCEMRYTSGQTGMRNWSHSVMLHHLLVLCW